jgi:uncharacterized membrane protein
MKVEINYSETLKSAWKGLLSQFWLLAGLVIGFTMIYSLLIIFSIPAGKEGITLSGIVVSILRFLFIVIFQMGYLKNCFQTLDGEEPQFSAYGQESLKIFKYIAAYILFSLIILAGLVLLVFPGVYLYLRLQFYMAFIVDENAGIIESFKKSWRITKGKTLSLLVLFFIMLLIILLGNIALIAGVFVAIPFVALIYAFVYRRLTVPSANDGEQ